MRTRNVQVALTVVLAAGLAAHSSATAGDEPPAKKAGPPRPQRPSPWWDEKGPFTFAGRVVGSDGKPIAGAKLYLLYQTPKELPVPARATSDAEGRFKFSVGRADFDRSLISVPWRSAYIVAVAPGYGLGLGGLFSSPLVESVLRLEQDHTPLHGRVLDLEGKPLAGVSVRVRGLYAPRVGQGTVSKDDLVNYVIAWNDGKGFRPPTRRPRVQMLGGNLLGRQVGALFPEAKTGTDGRFTIKGVGNDRIAELRIEGPTVVAQKVFAMTWAGKTVRADGPRLGSGPPIRVVTVYGNGFDHVAAPCQPVIGVVRDKDTGKPISGAVITNYVFEGHPRDGGAALLTVTDKEGHFRLLGLAKGKGNVLWARPPEGEPYLRSEQRVPEGPGLDAVTVDFRLKRGVWLTGRVRDKVTRAPVRAQIEYGVFEDNPHLEDVRGTQTAPLLNRADDGSFRLVGVPGRGLLAAQAMPDLRAGRLHRYSQGVGADRIKGLSPNGYFLTYPRPLPVRQYNTLVEVNPAADAKQVTCDILLDPGRQLTVTVLGPDGKPLAGVRARGVDPMTGPQSFRTAEIVVSAVGPGGPRLLQFDHAEKKLAGSLVVKGDEKGPLTVKLVAAGVLTGRLVMPDGEPITEGEILAFDGGPNVPVNRERPDRGSLPEPVRPDKDGKFRIAGMAPGLKYRFLLVRKRYGHPFGGAAADDLTFKPGETKDLGDVVIKLNE